jgi:hypothetical protein
MISYLSEFVLAPHHRDYLRYLIKLQSELAQCTILCGFAPQPALQRFFMSIFLKS